MHITITGVHIEITHAIREYVEERMNALSKYANKEKGVMRISVELSKTSGHHVHGDVYQVEVQAERSGLHINIKAIKNDLYAAIDEARDKLAREITERKDKEMSLFKRGAQRIKRILKVID